MSIFLIQMTTFIEAVAGGGQLWVKLGQNFRGLQARSGSTFCFGWKIGFGSAKLFSAIIELGSKY